jgi:hypothetical protein|tara:strand:+ start:2025 stop:2762 length:738 start_codon:yes stop_codon:yes gene_type:complete
MEYLLPILFFFIAFIYSSVGMGGGSSYTSLMVIFGINYTIIPTVSLSLNLIVTSIGMVNFWRNGYGRVSLILPFLVTSIPMAYFAGLLNLPKEIFQLILLITLILVAVRIYILDEFKFSFHLFGVKKWIFIYSLGTLLGFVAGAAGIGGGIYLVPLIVIFGLGNEKEAAAAGTIFIWANSMAGLIARVQKNPFDFDFILPLIGAVIAGGYIGSYLGSFKFRAKTIQKFMGTVIIFTILFLFKGML